MKEKPLFNEEIVTGLSSPGVSGAAGGADNTPHINTDTPGFSDLPMALCDETYPTKGNMTRHVAKVHKDEFDLADSNTKPATTEKNSGVAEEILCQEIFGKHGDIIDKSDLKSIEAKQVNLDIEKNPKITNDFKKSKSTALEHDLIINENIEYEESELRLIIYQIVIGILLHLIILAIFIPIRTLTMEFNPRVVTPKITNQFGK